MFHTKNVLPMSFVCTSIYIINLAYNDFQKIDNLYFLKLVVCQFFSLTVIWLENQSFQISGSRTACLSFQIQAAHTILLREILIWNSGVYSDPAICLEYWWNLSLKIQRKNNCLQSFSVPLLTLIIILILKNYSDRLLSMVYLLHFMFSIRYRGVLRSENLISYKNELKYFCESSCSRVGELSAVLDSISLLISQQRADCDAE